MIHTVEGQIKAGESLTIHGEGFSEKENPRPYFLWESDHGSQPRDVGRHTSWSGSVNGEPSAEKISGNSSQSWRFDHGRSSGAALGGVEFQSDQLFVFRRTYEDFDTSKDFSIRTRVTNMEGQPEAGQTVTGQSSGATGVIQSVSEDGSNRYAIYYEKSGGSINGDNPTDFEYGEVMTTETATFENTEGTSTYPTGTYRTFNFKTFRLWNQQYNNNIHLGAGRDKKFNLLPEGTDGMFWNGSMDIPLRQREHVWKSEEVYYQSGSLNTRDGILDFRMDNTQHYDHKIVMRNDSRPGKYDIVYQSQVSNGAQPGSYIYYDHLYIDDSWHHVAACEAPTWSECTDKALQVPLEWEDSRIKVEFNPRHLTANEDFFLYIVDGEGNANQEGFRVCMECPESPELRVE
ncbi:MAG: hypothetical protein R3296_12725 [Oleiphilaceae bacterium]|nr:hypothetical protein [Oleiphilaceae bacterium]